MVCAPSLFASHITQTISHSIEQGGLTFLTLVRFRDKGQRLLGTGLSHPGTMGGEPGAMPQDTAGGSAATPYAPVGTGQGPTSAPIGGGGGVGQVDSYYPPTF